MKRFSRAIVPGSFDPVTFGHLRLIERAQTEADTVIAVVLDSDLKAPHYLYSRSTRAAMLKRAVWEAKLKNVAVVSYEGLLIDAFSELGADALVRGCRSAADRQEDERQMAIHSHLLPGLTERVVYLEAEDELREVSSSTVKALVCHDVPVADMVPLFVKRELEEALRGQFRLAVAGPIASGKTYISMALAACLRQQLNISAWRVGVDELVRSLYIEATPGAEQLREEYARLLGKDVLTANGKAVKPTVMKQRLFDAQCTQKMRQQIHELTAPLIQRKLRQFLHNKQGLILFEWAKLAESEMAPWANNNVLLVESPDREALAEKRGIPSAEFRAIDAHQWSVERQAESLQAAAEAEGTGTLLHYINRQGAPMAAVAALAKEVLKMFPRLQSSKGGLP